MTGWGMGRCRLYGIAPASPQPQAAPAGEQAPQAERTQAPPAQGMPYYPGPRGFPLVYGRGRGGIPWGCGRGRGRGRAFRFFW